MRDNGKRRLNGKDKDGKMIRPVRKYKYSHGARVRSWDMPLVGPFPFQKTDVAGECSER